MTAYEHQLATASGQSYQRSSFTGDRVLALVVTDMLMAEFL